MSSPGAPAILCRNARGDGTVEDAGRYETHGDRKRVSVVACAISSIEPASGVSGATDCAQAMPADSTLEVRMPSDLVSTAPPRSLNTRSRINCLRLPGETQAAPLRWPRARPPGPGAPRARSHETGQREWLAAAAGRALSVSIDPLPPTESRWGSAPRRNAAAPRRYIADPSVRADDRRLPARSRPANFEHREPVPPPGWLAAPRPAHKRPRSPRECKLERHGGRPHADGHAWRRVSPKAPGRRDRSASGCGNPCR